MYKTFKVLLTLILSLLFVLQIYPKTEVKGIVLNGLNGKAVKNARVTVKGNSNSTYTDARGEFNLIVPQSKNENTSLIIKLIIEKNGFKPEEYSLKDTSDQSLICLLPITQLSIDENYFSSNLYDSYLLKEDVEWEDVIDGVRLYHEDRIKKVAQHRRARWSEIIQDESNILEFTETSRDKLRKILGAVDNREQVSLTAIELVSETDKYSIKSIKWTVLKEILQAKPLQDWPKLDVPTKIMGEGLLLEPNYESKGFVIAIPDADQSPESLVGLNNEINLDSPLARKLVENGYTVIVPTIANRSNKWSRGTNKSSRTWIYSQAFDLGRTVAGYEVQKIEALIDWIYTQQKENLKVGLAGYGEGGLLALYTAALDTRVDATLISGYFAPREEVWKEPIYRNMWGFVSEFGDAEIASLISPRHLVVEYSNVPLYDENINDGTKIEPPAQLFTHTYEEVKQEFDRISSLTKTSNRELISGDNNTPVSFGSQKALNSLMKLLGNTHEILEPSDKLPIDYRKDFNSSDRMGRMVEQMVGHTQMLLRNSEYSRRDFIKSYSDKEELRTYFKSEMIGWTHDDLLPINPRTRLIEEHTDYRCYEVLIDVLPNIVMWGVLTIPTDIKETDKRPTIVMQHGRGGNPYTALDENNSYYGIGRRLAKDGFVVYTPFGNWTGETRFRWIDRIAKPAKNTIWSTIGKQHQQLFRWFQTLPFVDSDKIGIYGKSIGGQAASLIASMLPEYALSINCAYFNDGARKVSSIYFPTSFVYHVDSEMPMWNRANTMEYAEMANYLIFPRPFMVEHGKQDGIAPPGWVEYEYNKVHKFYNEHNKGDKTDIHLHDGGHIINGVKTIPFLKKHLNLKRDD